MITRRIGERIVIGGTIEIVVTELTRKTVRLAVKAPNGLLVFRGEVHDSIEAANRAAAATSLDEDALLQITPTAAALEADEAGNVR